MRTRASVMSRSFVWGAGSFLGLLLFYFLLVGLVESWSHAIQLVSEDLFFVLAIAGGLGIQVGLFAYLKQLQHLAHHKGLATVTASGTGTSTISMVACCLHHLGDFLPLIGLSGATLFFEQYRYPLMWVGIAANVMGIYLLLRLIIRKRLWPRFVFS